MPKRTDIKSILIIGAGPIVIGQACEFDYSGVQACKALREEGYRVILVNSNPATIMTDPGLADATYLEPITLELVEQIIEKDKRDIILGLEPPSEILITELSHNIYGAIGGFHLFRSSDEVISKTASSLKSFGLKQLVGGHCTGIHAARKIADIASITRDNLSHGAIGTVVTTDLKILRSSVE